MLLQLERIAKTKQTRHGIKSNAVDRPFTWRKHVIYGGKEFGKKKILKLTFSLDFGFTFEMPNNEQDS